MPEEQGFYHTALSEARIAKNANLSDIFPFEFKANELPFLLRNAAANKQKAITAMYTEAKAEEKPICLILDSGSTGNIITYQLMQQLKRNVDQPAQTIIVTADGMKKTPVREIDNFPFTIDRITILVKVLVMDAPQYQALIGNNWLQKANLTISYQKQHVRVPATCGTFYKHSKKAPAFEFELEKEKPIIETFMALGSTSNWADETEQHDIQMECPLFKTRIMKTMPLHSTQMQKLPQKTLINGSLYFTQGRIQKSYLLLLQILSPRTMGTPSQKKWKMGQNALFDLEGVCNQTCQYVFLISEKVTRGTPFDAVYNSTLNKLYHYFYDAEMIFNLAMALINGATQKNVRQIKKSEYIAYTFEITGYNYENEVEVYHQIANHTYLTKEA
ncbi:hypothetical protein G9A89_004814 [Geosiphon pyriformis]|nr:hypothetical protein G9A89_004814 [Geosiphon pyriformis]